jgi:hypothetical protein
VKKQKTFKEAKDFGLNIKVNKELDKLSGQALFPEKLEQANKILSNMKFSHLK